MVWHPLLSLRSLCSGVLRPSRSALFHLLEFHSTLRVGAVHRKGLWFLSKKMVDLGAEYLPPEGDRLPTLDQKRARSTSRGFLSPG